MRGLVISDVFRRFVSKAIAFELAPAFHAATAPFQYALSTRADAEAAARVLSVLLEDGPTKTLLSVDGVGAYDHISRQAMLAGVTYRICVISTVV